MKEIGKKIKELRIEKGLSQEELALMCGYKSRSSINKIELGKDAPLKKLEAIAKALNTDLSDIIGWEATPEDIEEHDTDDTFLLTLAKLGLSKEQEEQVLDYAKYLISKS